MTLQIEEWTIDISWDPPKYYCCKSDQITWVGERGKCEYCHKEVPPHIKRQVYVICGLSDAPKKPRWAVEYFYGWDYSHEI